MMDKDDSLSSLNLQNHLRLNLLLNYGNTVLRQLFQVEYRKVYNREWEDGSIAGDDLIKRLDALPKFQKDLLKKGDLNDWDMAALSSVIKSMTCSHSPHQKSKEKRQQQQLIVKIEEVKNVRDTVFHLPVIKNSMSKSEFTRLWKQAEGALVFLGGDSNEIERLRTASNISGVEFKSSGAPNSENMEKSLVLKKEGNLFVQNKDFEMAITKYSQALEFVGLTDKEKSILHSNRSHAYCNAISNNNEKSLGDNCDLKFSQYSTSALEDAKKAVLLCPTWWKGYVRAAKVHTLNKNWNAASVFYSQAMLLNPPPNELEDIITARADCDFELGREESHLLPEERPQSEAERLSKLKRHKDIKFDSNLVAKQLMKVNREILDKETAGVKMDPSKVGDAAMFFARLHIQGIDLPEDYSKAFDYLTLAAKNGNAEAMHKLGVFYMEGRGRPKDFLKGNEHFEEAARQPLLHKDGSHGTKCGRNQRNFGVAEAQYSIGKSYDEGLGKPLDYKKAAEWYHRASENESMYAPYALGILYARGRGVEYNIERAFQYWKLSVIRGSVTAMDMITQYYLNHGDLDMAQLWFDRSIQEGNVNTFRTKKQFSEEIQKRRKSMTTVTASQKQEISHVQLTNPFRVETVLLHRQSVKELSNQVKVESKKKFPCPLSAKSVKPLRDQKLPSKLSSLREITFSEIHPLKDFVYEGKFIKLVVCEDIYPRSVFTTIQTVVRDENWDVQRGSFYHLSDEEKTRFFVGSEITVINPYFRLASDGGTGIRVDDPKSIIFHSEVSLPRQICRFCGKVDSTNKCGRCDRVFYCGKECQENDWKILKHKLVCDSELDKYL